MPGEGLKNYYEGIFRRRHNISPESKAVENDESKVNLNFLEISEAIKEADIDRLRDFFINLIANIYDIAIPAYKLKTGSKMSHGSIEIQDGELNEIIRDHSGTIYLGTGSLGERIYVNQDLETNKFVLRFGQPTERDGPFAPYLYKAFINIFGTDTVVLDI